MCGIFGFYNVEGLGNLRSAVQSANDIVDYRGPDGAGFIMIDLQSKKCKTFQDGKLRDEEQPSSGVLIMGHRRLSIIDLTAAGHQPMCSGDGLVWIVHNGEIYNYVELRTELEKAGYRFHSKTDTEVILNAYREWGEDCVRRFNGMWAFGIADLRRDKVFCSRDRFGIKPLYYYYDGKHFIFSSEIKQMLCFPFIRKQINDLNIYEFLAFGTTASSKEVFFLHINQLLQGYNLNFDLKGKTLSTDRYYKPLFSINNRVTYSEAAEEFKHLIMDSVRLRLRSDVEVGSCLSGGLDSSVIVCVMNQLLKARGRNEIQKTFTLHFEEKEANELAYAEEVVGATGVRAYFSNPSQHELLEDLEELVWHQEEPFGSTSIFGQWSVFKLVHKHGIKVMLDGQGADEQLSGYIGLASYYFSELYEKRQWLRLAWEVFCQTVNHRKFMPSAIPGWPGKLARRFYPYPGKTPPTRNQDWINGDLVARCREKSYYLSNQQIKPFGEKEKLNNILYQLTFFNNLQDLLKYEDRNSMAFSVESRLPFLDYRLVEFLFSLGAQYKIRDGKTKRILRDGMSGLLPEKIRQRVGKLGFATPERIWQKTVLRPLIIKALQDERVIKYIMPEKALSYLLEVEKSSVTYFDPWRWLSLYLWMEVYGIE